MEFDFFIGQNTEVRKLKSLIKESTSTSLFMQQSVILSLIELC